MQWLWLFEGANSTEGERELNAWLLEQGFQLAVVEEVDAGLTRGSAGDAFRKLRAVVHDAAAVVTLLSVLSGDSLPPTSIAERSELVTQAKALAAEVERLQCTYDFRLFFLSADTGEQQELSSAELQALIQRLCDQ